MASPESTTQPRRRTFLREWRLHAKMTQIQAADRLDTKQGAISKIENGKQPYNQDFLEKAAVVYGAHEPADLLIVNPQQPRDTDLVVLFRRASPETQQIVEMILRREDR